MLETALPTMNPVLAVMNDICALGDRTYSSSGTVSKGRSDNRIGLCTIKGGDFEQEPAIGNRTLEATEALGGVSVLA